MKKNYKKYIILLSALTLFSSCAATNIESSYPPDTAQKRDQKYGKVTGKDGISFNKEGFSAFGKNFSTGKDTAQSNNKNLKNNYLWKAAIDILDFMPLTSIDSETGSIITDWYSTKKNKKTRFKVNALITGKEFNISSLKVKIYKENFDEKLGWQNIEVKESIHLEIENKILNHARNLKNTK